MQYAASYALHRVPDCEVAFRDSIAAGDSYPQFYRMLEEDLYPDYVVIESATPCWKHDAVVIDTIAAILPKCRVILTGPIAAARGPEIVASGLVYAAVAGEYEKGVVRVLNGESGFIPHDLLTVAEMNAAPPPWLDDDHWNLYWDSNPRGQLAPHLQLWTSRGCFARCSFCSWPATMTGNDPTGDGKRTVRHYTADYMLAYLTEATKRYPYRSLYADDDLFNTSDRHVLEMCDVFRKIGLPWSAMCRADTIKPSTWMAMKNSGCFGVKIGFEVGSQRVMDDIINKRLDIAEAVETLRYLKSIGLTIHTTWMVGLPGETLAEQQETLSLIQRLYDAGLTDTHQLSGAASIEGTPLEQIGLGKALAKYPGATPDANYVSDSDGGHKLRTLAGAE